MNEQTLIELDQCQAHPQQAETYGDLSEASLATLRQSMQAEGQRDPIVVLPPDNAAGLPPYTVLDGHQRLEAARQLGWTTVRATIRHDLVDAEEAVVRQTFLRFNFERRQLTPMHQAMIIMERYEARVGRPRQRFNSDDWQAVEAQIAGQLDLSSRNALRYMRVLNTPRAIQIAVRDRRLNKLTLAERIETLPKPKQEELAEAIEQIDDPKAAKALVESYFPVQSKAPTPGQVFEQLTETLDQAQRVLPKSVTGEPLPRWRDYLPALESGYAFLGQLVQQVREIDPDANPLDKLRAVLLQHQ